MTNQEFVGKIKRNIKKIVLIFYFILLLILFCGCGNKDMWDSQYTFDRAIVILNDGTKMEIEIQKWCDYEGEQIQIIGKDGKVYLVSSYNTILIKD